MGSIRSTTTPCRGRHPAPAHLSIAALEHDNGLDVSVVTQNVDGLHTAAGSTWVFELHGSLQRVRCMESNHTSALDTVTWGADGVPLCPTCAGVCRPDVVLFGESLPAGTWDGAAAAISVAATIIAVGTSAQVYPAALLIADDRTAHARRIWINPETPPPSDTWQWIQATADEALSGRTQASHVAVLDPANTPSATYRWAPVANGDGNQRAHHIGLDGYATGETEPHRQHSDHCRDLYDSAPNGVGMGIKGPRVATATGLGHSAQHSVNPIHW